MKKIVYICLILLTGSLGIFAQTGIIPGTVVDSDGVAIPGVTVIVKGTTQGGISDVDGNFEISAASGSTLVFSYVGMQTQEIEVTNQSALAIIMIEDVGQIGELVVVGYGEMKKESLTAAISNIKAEDIVTTKHSSLAQALQGKVPGLQIRQNTGQPGRFDTRINIRGFGTPLFVIDGVAREGGNEFQRINPEDIESISVLKDAATAIYGRRGGNGVIIVTTKKGKEGKPKFTYNASYGFQAPTDVPRMANAFEFVTMRNRSNTSRGFAPLYDSTTLASYEQGLPGYESTDWYEATFKPYAVRQSHDFSATGGTDKVQYYASFGYQEDGGILRSNDNGYDKYTFRTNVTAALTKNLKATVAVAGRRDFTFDPGANFFNIFKVTRVAHPTVPVYANGDPLYPSTAGQFEPRNPVALSDRDISGYNETVNKNIQSSITLEYTIPFIKGLKLKGQYSYDSNNQMNKNLSKSYYTYEYVEADDTYTRFPHNTPSSISNTWRDYSQLNLQTQILYQNTFADAHDVSGMLMYEQNSTDYRWASLRRDYSFYTNDQIGLADLNNMTNDGNETQTGNKSVIGRFNYGFKGKYLVEFAFRRDGSYRYAPEYQFANFWVATGGWRISEESFFQDNISFISNAKLRGSYGVVGEDAGAAFQYVEGFSTSGGGGYEFTEGIWTLGVGAPAIVNPDLTWFTSKITNLGLDLGFFENAISVEFEVYQRMREGLLAKRNISLPNTFGASLPDENLNSDLVRGIESSIAFKNNFGQFYYEVRANFNLARTLRQYVERGPFTSSWDRWRNGREYRYNDIEWGYEIEGQFQNEEEIIMAPLQGSIADGNSKELPGDFRYRDVNGDGYINNEDRLPLFYNSTPKQYYGLTLAGSWKGFDFSALLQGAGKYTVRFREIYAQMFAFQGNTPAYFHDAWHIGDDGEWVEGTWPANREIGAVGAMYHDSEMWRRDASYVRLKSVDLGYTFRNMGWTQKLNIGSLRIYVNAHNLFTICDPFVKPFDPEKIEGSYDAGLTYPLTKSYNFGINLNF